MDQSRIDEARATLGEICKLYQTAKSRYGGFKEEYRVIGVEFYFDKKFRELIAKLGYIINNSMRGFPNHIKIPLNVPTVYKNLQRELEKLSEITNYHLFMSVESKSVQSQLEELEQRLN